jgi:hypothetical protein
MTFIVVRHRRKSGETLHRHPSFEQCNVDTAIHRRLVTDIQAVDLWEAEKVKLCEHCRPLDEPTLNTRSDLP